MASKTYSNNMFAFVTYKLLSLCTRPSTVDITNPPPISCSALTYVLFLSLILLYMLIIFELEFDKVLVKPPPDYVFYYIVTIMLGDLMVQLPGKFSMKTF